MHYPYTCTGFLLWTRVARQGHTGVIQRDRFSLSVMCLSFRTLLASLPDVESSHPLPTACCPILLIPETRFQYSHASPVPNHASCQLRTPRATRKLSDLYSPPSRTL